MKARQWGFFLGLILLGAVFRTRSSPAPVAATRFLLNTMVTITAYGPRAPAALPKAWAVLREADSQLDPYRTGSELWRLNHARGHWVRVSPLLYGCLREALAVARQSNGAFDPTVWPLTQAWAFGAPPGQPVRPHLPDPVALDRARALVGYRKVRLSPPDWVRLRSGMGLDLGGIAKGYAADLAAAALRRAGVSSALLDLGDSTILALGPKPDGQPWRIALDRPRGSGYLGYVELRQGALGTSGDYRDFFTLAGRRYSHIFDPHSGWPAETCAAVTVRGASGALTDAGGTAAFVLGAPKGQRWLRLRGESGLFVSPTDHLTGATGFGLKPWHP